MSSVFILLLIIGIIAGFVMHRSDFCVASMLRDIFMFNRFDTVFSLFFLLLMSAALYLLLFFTGLIDISHPWAGMVGGRQFIGGIIFGAGMVLAGGCVIGTLYKIGSGNVSSFFAFIGILCGSFVYAVIYPEISNIAGRLDITSSFVSLYSLIHIPMFYFFIFYLVAFAMLFFFLKNKNKLFLKSHVYGFLQPFYASVILSFCLAGIFLITKMPLGITSTYTKFSAFFAHLISSDYYESFSYFSNTVLNYHNSFADSDISGKLGYHFDGIYLIQLPVIIGILAGSFFSALNLKEFSVNFHIPLKQFFIAVAGGFLMGFSSRLAGGCNVWYLFGQLPLLDLGAYLFLGGLLPGVWMGSKFLEKLIVG